MSQDLVPALLRIFTGVSFFGILLVGTLGRAALRPLWGRVAAFALAPLTLGLFLLSWATDRSSLSAGSEVFVAAGVSLLVSMALTVAALFLSARSSAG